MAPFTVDEEDVIIEWMYANFTAKAVQIYAPYFEFAFYCGMRTGELRALRRDEIDMEKRVAPRKFADARLTQRHRKRKEPPYMFPPSGGAEFILSSSTPSGHFAKALEASKIKPAQPI
jgi:integrase